MKILWPNWQGAEARRHRPRYRLLGLVFMLLAVGALIQFIISPTLAVRAVGEISRYNFFFRHLISISVGLAALYCGFRINLKYWLHYAPLILLGGVLLSVMTGGDRWIERGTFFSIQPVEIIKLGFILVVAGYLTVARNVKHKTIWQFLVANKIPLAILTVCGLIVVGMQKDFGSMFVIGAIFVAMVWVSGLSWRILASILAIFLVFSSIAILGEPYRRQRLTNFTECSSQLDDLGSCYQINQALIGIGSGGLIGRGVGRAVQVHGYLPESNNDSIFAIYAEHLGFIGSLILLGFIGGLLATLYGIAKRLEFYLMLITVGAIAWFGTQSFINIGSMVGLLPMKGITLPYISYGGSSLVLVLLTTGIILQISTYTRLER